MASRLVTTLQNRNAPKKVLSPGAENLEDPLSFDPVTGLPSGASRRRSLQDILSSDEAFDTSVEQDDAAFDRYLQAGEAARRREEDAATEQVLNSAQSRGLARSGIALKDIVTQVLGPSQERAGQLAAQFGLERARRASETGEAARGRRLSAILQGDAADIGQDQQILQGLQNFQQGKQQGSFGVLQSREQAKASSADAAAARKSARQNALIGGGAGIIGGILGLCFHPDTEIHMADGSKKKIKDVQLGDDTAGGKVLVKKESIADDMHIYEGVKVTGSHSVNENGTWKHVVDSKESKKLDGVWRIVSIVTSDHRIYIDGYDRTIEFGDEAENDNSARLGGTMTDAETLAELNRQEQEKVNAKAA